MGRPRGLPPGTLEPRKRSENAALVLLSLWRRPAHLYRNALRPTRSQTAAGNRPPAIHAAYHAGLQIRAEPTDYTASQTRYAHDLDRFSIRWRPEILRTSPACLIQRATRSHRT